MLWNSGHGNVICPTCGSYYTVYFSPYLKAPQLCPFCNEHWLELKEFLSQCMGQQEGTKSLSIIKYLQGNLDIKVLIHDLKEGTIRAVSKEIRMTSDEAIKLFIRMGNNYGDANMIVLNAKPVTIQSLEELERIENMLIESYNKSDVSENIKKVEQQ